MERSPSPPRGTAEQSGAAAPSPLWIVDGTSLLLPAWFAGAPGVAPGGQPCGAVRVFARRLSALARQHAMELGVVLFDVSLDTFRRRIDPAYKAHRPEPPPSLVWELAQAEHVARALGFPVLATPELEADDLAATLCRWARRDGRPARVLADDKDLFQLVVDTPPTVTIHSLRSKKVWDGAAVHARLGVRPHQVVDYQALVGDPTDGVTGVAGIGAKTAAAVLQLGTLDALLADPDRAADAPVRGARRLPERLRAGADVARLARRLVTLRTDADLPAAARLGTPPPTDSHLVRGPVDAADPVWARLGVRAPRG